jgi:hypothetical protein
LSFGHHHAVLGLDDEQADALLDRTDRRAGELLREMDKNEAAASRATFP